MFNFTNPIITETTLYAKWAQTFTVRFQANGGTEITDQMVESGQQAVRPEDPTKASSVFKDWYSDADFSTVFNFTNPITTETTLYAKWAQTFTVRFDSNDGTAVSPISGVLKGEGEKITKPTDPTQEGYIFVGWRIYRDGGLTFFNFDTEVITTTNTILYASWKRGAVIPDEHFRAKLKRLIPEAFQGDLLNPDYSEVTSLKKLDVNQSDIVSMEGIEYFTALTELNCTNNKIKILDISGNTNLTKLSCSDNELTSLVGPNYLKNFERLTDLYCHNNQLTNLNFLVYTPALEKINCSNNQLTKLPDISSYAPKWQDLNCSNNQLDDLLITSALTTLNCSNNKLIAFGAVNSKLALTDLNCSSNKLSTLNGITTRLGDLTTLNCSSNKLTSLELQVNPKLTTLDCSNNALTFIDLRGMRSITSLIVKPSVDGKNPLSRLRVLDVIRKHALIKAIVKTVYDASEKGNFNFILTTYSEGNTVSCQAYDPFKSKCLL